jgi:hypothetical protein
LVIGAAHFAYPASCGKERHYREHICRLRYTIRHSPVSLTKLQKRQMRRQGWHVRPEGGHAADRHSRSLAAAECRNNGRTGRPGTRGCSTGGKVRSPGGVGLLPGMEGSCPVMRGS